MRWLDWLRGHRERAGAEEAIDLERLLLEGFRDLPSARHAISRLTRERKELARQRRAVDAQFRRLTSGRVKTIVRDRSASPQMQVDMLSQAMQDANAATQTQA